MAWRFVGGRWRGLWKVGTPKLIPLGAPNGNWYAVHGSDAAGSLALYVTQKIEFDPNPDALKRNLNLILLVEFGARQ